MHGQLQRAPSEHRLDHVGAVQAVDAVAAECAVLSRHHLPCGHAHVELAGWVGARWKVEREDEDEGN